MWRFAIETPMCVSLDFASPKCDGQTASGLLVNRNNREIQLRDADGNLRAFDMARVESVEAQEVSLMPANLHQTMTAQQLVDLVEYLGSLRGVEAGNEAEPTRKSSSTRRPAFE